MMKYLQAIILYFALVVPAVALNAPDRLVATAISSTEIKLTWRDRSTAETGFSIYRSSDGGATFQKIADIPANSTFFVDSGLAPNASYTYHVAAFAASVNSNGSTATTPQVVTTEAAPNGIAGTFKLIFSDEFDAPSLDANIWNANWLGSATACTKPVNSAELGAYCPSQVALVNGNLELTAIAASTLASDGKTYAYRSGLIESASKKEFVPPIIIEFKIQGEGAGQVLNNWMAGWLNGHHVSWPDRGENDVVENLSGGPAWHYHAPGVNAGSTIAGSWGGWHTYASEWTASRVDFYYDGKPVGSVTSGVLSYPQYIVINYAISTQHGGALVVPSKMLIDYVRVWSRT